jgi:hypothetical protein
VSKELVRVAIKRSGFSKKKARLHGRPKDFETNSLKKGTITFLKADNFFR